MASKKAIQQLVRKLYDARKRGDLDTMASVMTPRFVHSIAGDRGLCSITGKTTGRGAFRSRMDGLINFAFTNQKLLSFLVDGDSATIHWRTKVTYKATGKSGTMDFIDHLSVKNGKIDSLVQFGDTALLAEIMN